MSTIAQNFQNVYMRETSSLPSQIPKSGSQGAFFPPSIPVPEVYQYVGQVINGSICFRLLPQSNRIFCPFSFTHNAGYRVVLAVNPPNVCIPFVLNEIPYSYNETEVDITEQLENGDNYLICNTMEVDREVIVSI